MIMNMRIKLKNKAILLGSIFLSLCASSMGKRLTGRNGFPSICRLGRKTGQSVHRHTR